VKFACCGHGGHGQVPGYIYFENGVRIGFELVDVTYDDDRHRINVDRRKPRKLGVKNVVGQFTTLTPKPDAG
jgi:hypothetical protein